MGLIKKFENKSGVGIEYWNVGSFGWTKNDGLSVVMTGFLDKSARMGNKSLLASKVFMIPSKEVDFSSFDKIISSCYGFVKQTNDFSGSVDD